MGRVSYTTASLYDRCLEGINPKTLNSPEGKAAQKGLKMFLHKSFNRDIDGGAAFIILSSLVIVILSTIHGISPNVADGMRYAALGAAGGALVLNKPLTWIHYNYVTLSEKKVQKLMNDLRSNMQSKKHFGVDYPRWVSDGVTRDSDFNPVFNGIKENMRGIQMTLPPLIHLQEAQEVR